MTTIEEVCCHNVEFWYDTDDQIAVPDDSEIEHVADSIRDGYRQGELCMNLPISSTEEHEFCGWWKILKEN